MQPSSTIRLSNPRSKVQEGVGALNVLKQAM